MKLEKLSLKLCQGAFQTLSIASVISNQHTATKFCIPIEQILFSAHYDDVIMTTMASQITSLAVVYSIVYSDADQRKHQSSASLAFVRGIHRDR